MTYLPSVLVEAHFLRDRKTKLFVSMGTLSLAHITMYTGKDQQHSDAIHVFAHKKLPLSILHREVENKKHNQSLQGSGHLIW